MKKRWIFRLLFAAPLLSPREGHKKPSGFNKNLLAYKLICPRVSGRLYEQKEHPLRDAL